MKYIYPYQQYSPSFWIIIKHSCYWLV